MARVFAYDKAYYRVRVVETYFDLINNEEVVYTHIYGPYSSEKTAKTQGSREKIRFEGWKKNNEDILQGRVVSRVAPTREYIKCEVFIETATVDWKPI